MNGFGERETRRIGPALIGTSLLGRERERKRPDQEYAAESGSCFIFHHSIYGYTLRVTIYVTPYVVTFLRGR